MINILNAVGHYCCSCSAWRASSSCYLNVSLCVQDSDIFVHFFYTTGSSCQILEMVYSYLRVFGVILTNRVIYLLLKLFCVYFMLICKDFNDSLPFLLLIILVFVGCDTDLPTLWGRWWQTKPWYVLGIILCSAFN